MAANPIGCGTWDIIKPGEIQEMDKAINVHLLIKYTK